MFKKIAPILIKKIIYIGFFLLISAICLCLHFYGLNNYDEHTLYGNSATTDLFDLQKDMLITQEFSARDLRGAGVNFEAIQDIESNPNVDIMIELYDNESNEKIASSIINTLTNGAGPQRLMIPSGEVYKKGLGNYRLEVKQLSEGLNGNKLQVLTEQAPAIDDNNKMTINGVQQIAKLSITSLESSPVTFIPVFYVLLLFVIMGSIYMILEKKGIEKIFLVMFFGLGIIYSLLMSPFVIPDEATHYDRAYSLSNRFMGYEETMRREEDKTLNTYLHTPNKDSVQSTLNNLFAISDLNDMVDNDIVHSKANKIIPYLAPSIGITIGKLLHFGATSMFYIGRLMNLIITGLLICYAIKIIPFGKIVIFAISFLPMTLHLVGSYSYDGLVISSTILFASYIIYLKYTKKSIQKRDLVVLTVLPLLFLSAKSFGYIAFLLLLGILPWKTEFKKQKKGIIAFIMIGGCLFLYTSGMISLIKDLFTSNTVSTTIEIDTLNVSMHTYGDVLRSPFKYIIMVLGTLYRNIETYLKDMVGNNLCWYTFPVKEFIIYLFWLLLLFSGLNKEDHEYDIRLNDRALIGTAGITTCLIVVLSMAIAFTPGNMDIIIGVQGRYFIPALVLLLLFVHNYKISLNRDISIYLIVICLTLQIFTVMDILLNIIRI